VGEIDGRNLDVDRDAVPTSIRAQVEAREPFVARVRRVSRNRETSARGCSDTSEYDLRCKEDS
jgi:hypothetical protein